MINFKKTDEKDFIFVKKPLSEKEEKEFSEFLKLLKAKASKTRVPKVKKKVAKQ